MFLFVFKILGVYIGVCLCVCEKVSVYLGAYECVCMYIDI